MQPPQSSISNCYLDDLPVPSGQIHLADGAIPPAAAGVDVEGAVRHRDAALSRVGLRRVIPEPGAWDGRAPPTCHVGELRLPGVPPGPQEVVGVAERLQARRLLLVYGERREGGRVESSAHVHDGFLGAVELLSLYHVCNVRVTADAEALWQE